MPGAQAVRRSWTCSEVRLAAGVRRLDFSAELAPAAVERTSAEKVQALWLFRLPASTGFTSCLTLQASVTPAVCSQAAARGRSSNAQCTLPAPGCVCARAHFGPAAAFQCAEQPAAAHQLASATPLAPSVSTPRSTLPIQSAAPAGLRCRPQQLWRHQKQQVQKTEVQTARRRTGHLLAR